MADKGGSFFERHFSWLWTTPISDEDRVGITFVDVLFALVVAEIMSPLRRYWTLPGTAFSHLAVAMVLTLGSWIGYHLSANRPQYAPKFFNLPLLQILLDVAMVIVYWMTATTAPLPEHVAYIDVPAPVASALPESILVSAALLLYVFWDRVGRAIQTRPHYPSIVQKSYDPGRRKITFIFWLLSLAVVGFAWYVDRRWRNHWGWVVGIDIILIVLLVLYRAAKEVWKNWMLRPREAAAA